MWSTCYNCNGSGIEPDKNDNKNLSKKECEEKTCHVCNQYRITGDNFEFYGQIWIIDDYEISTPPSSP
jgi:hypothetical protein